MVAALRRNPPTGEDCCWPAQGEAAGAAGCGWFQAALGASGCGCGCGWGAAIGAGPERGTEPPDQGLALPRKLPPPAAGEGAAARA